MVFVSGLPEAVSLLRRHGGGGVRRAADLSRRDRRDPVCCTSRTDAADGDASEAKNKNALLQEGISARRLPGLPYISRPWRDSIAAERRRKASISYYARAPCVCACTFDL